LPAKEDELFPRCTLSKGALPVSDEPLKASPEDDFLNFFLDEIDEDDLDEFAEDQIWDETQGEFDAF
jgi:hypothetical protein